MVSVKHCTEVWGYKVNPLKTPNPSTNNKKPWSFTKLWEAAVISLLQIYILLTLREMR